MTLEIKSLTNVMNSNCSIVVSLVISAVPGTLEVLALADLSELSSSLASLKWDSLRCYHILVVFPTYENLEGRACNSLASVSSYLAVVSRNFPFLAGKAKIIPHFAHGSFKS